MKDSEISGSISDIFHKGYFTGPAKDLINFRFEKDICPVCKENKFKFILPPFGEYNKCCLDCLLNIDITFRHNSEYGPITSEIFLPEFNDLSDIRNHVDDKKIQALLITPEFTSIQGSYWQIHCNDFMNFRGIWNPPDFTKNSPEMNGKKLFLEMTPEDNNYLWNECNLADNELEYVWEDIQYYSFECRHCKKLKGYWDCL